MNMKKIAVGMGLFLAACCLFFLGRYALDDGADFEIREDSTKRTVTAEAADDDRYRISLVTMDQGSNFWQLLDAGCRQAVKEMGGIRYRWVAPAEHTVEKQRECIDRAVADGAQALLVSAISETEVNDNLARAAAAGVKLVYVDSAATFPALATLMTDSEAAGQVAGQTMRKALAEAGIRMGTIGVAAVSPNAQNAIRRIHGFRAAFDGSPFTVAPTAYINNDWQNIRDHVKEHPDFVGFFGSNEQTTRVISEEVKRSGRRQIIIGFDTSDFILSMIKEGVIYATMQQKPQQMGHDGIAIAVAALKGKYQGTGDAQDMGVVVITRDKI